MRSRSVLFASLSKVAIGGYGGLNVIPLRGISIGFTLGGPHRQTVAAEKAKFATPPHLEGATEGPWVLYKKGLESGKYRHDPRQALTTEKLQRLYDDLKEDIPSATGSGGGLAIVDAISSTNPKAGGSWWQRLVTATDESESDVPSPSARPPTQGLYMYGGVGCGKTMLMDLFILSSPPRFKVRRAHFHDFMLDIHSQLRKYSKEPDPLLKVAAQYSRECRVLCLDELMVTDVADAMILHRLFGRLWKLGMILVSTSNRKPDDLYENGLQRNLFLPFIKELKERCQVHDMASAVDYRRLARHVRGLYFVGQDRDATLEERFEELAQGEAAPATIEVMMGRTLPVPRANMEEGVCLFSFSDLCDRPVGAPDYLALAERFHTVCLQGVPVFTAANRAAGHRFVTMVDILYEHRVRVLISAEAPIFQLLDKVVTHRQLTEQRAEAQKHGGRSSSGHSSSSSQGHGHSQGHHSGPPHPHHSRGAASPPPGLPLLDESQLVVDDVLGFSKDRTISRLTEMQSKEYLKAHAQRHAPELLPAVMEEETLAKMKMMTT